jgi:hypothetical protein
VHRVHRVASRRVRGWYATPQPFNLLALAIAFWIASELIGGLAKSGILPH